MILIPYPQIIPCRLYFDGRAVRADEVPTLHQIKYEAVALLSVIPSAATTAKHSYRKVGLVK